MRTIALVMIGALSSQAFAQGQCFESATAEDQQVFVSFLEAHLSPCNRNVQFVNGSAFYNADTVLGIGQRIAYLQASNKSLMESLPKIPVWVSFLVAGLGIAVGIAGGIIAGFALFPRQPATP